ncbi:DUF2283 domain-containing protein [Gloeothece verrucosa]|uniref:DUF2283 domain-containing protein n=1 Tax=Gloeothece verrucosa (strain PCC 7822) TaxID=497965 RepID=E0UJ19_GLOV7|nr:DUF2283 domain-containing protein [Gloeothece verrucosa]ADN14599.1 Protein of unknown function DUF2283 [Gloeothece verrucosa PCC 7822]
MKFNYYPETDSLYISLSDKTSTDSQEIAPDLVLDFDSEGKLVGIDIDQSSKIVDLTCLETESLPLNSVILTQPK